MRLGKRAAKGNFHVRHNSRAPRPACCWIPSPNCSQHVAVARLPNLRTSRVDSLPSPAPASAPPPSCPAAASVAPKLTGCGTRQQLGGRGSQVIQGLEVPHACSGGCPQERRQGGGIKGGRLRSRCLKDAAPHPAAIGWRAVGRHLRQQALRCLRHYEDGPGLADCPTLRAHAAVLGSMSSDTGWRTAVGIAPRCCCHTPCAHGALHCLVARYMVGCTPGVTCAGCCCCCCCCCCGCRWDALLWTLR
jgi:hypothetical protein